MTGRFTMHDHLPPEWRATMLRDDALTGLSGPRKTLPPKWLYA